MTSHNTDNHRGWKCVECKGPFIQRCEDLKHTVADNSGVDGCPECNGCGKPSRWAIIDHECTARLEYCADCWPLTAQDQAGYQRGVREERERLIEVMENRLRVVRSVRDSYDKEEDPDDEQRHWNGKVIGYCEALALIALRTTKGEDRP